jgi:hypothetical protein
VDEGSAVRTGQCAPPTPVAPSGDLTTDCVEGGGHVVASHLDSGTAGNVTWRLVSGTNDTHDTVVGGPTANGPLEASGLPDATQVWLQYAVGSGDWVDEGSVVTTGQCAPEVAPSGSFTVVCSDTGADVTIGTLSSGSKQDVVWTLTYGSAAKTVSTGDVVAVPAQAELALSFIAGDSTSGTVQTGTAPETCGNTVVLGEHHSHNPDSNQPTAVLGVSLAHTGLPAQLPWTLGFAALFLVVGSALIFLTRRPQAAQLPSGDLN